MSNWMSASKRVQGVACAPLRWLAASLGLVLGLTLLALMPASPASAQLFFSRRLPPGQIISMVQSRGYTYPTYPYYRGDIYVVDANEPRGNRIRLVIDPNSGEIVERLLIRQQRVVPGPSFDDTYVRSGVPRIVNPSEEAIGGQTQDRRPVKRTARRPVERAPERSPGAETPAATPSETEPQAATPRESEPIARPTRQAPAAPVATAPPTAAPSATPSPAPSAAPSATAPTAAVPGSVERGTRANPRRVGPVLPPAVGVD